MSRGTALVAARELRTSLLDHGVARVSIELREGRPAGDRDRWLNTRFVGVMAHHTAGPLRGDTPSLAICKAGRAGVPGPLCNVYGGRDDIVRILTLGLANHSGRGGPWTLTGSNGQRYRVPANSGRPYLLGVEWENTGTGSEPWTDARREEMGRTHAGILDWLGAPVTNLIEHLTWAPDRKIDRYGYSALSGQAEARPYLENDMTPEQDKLLREVADQVGYLRREIGAIKAQGKARPAEVIATAARVSEANANRIARVAAAVGQLQIAVDADDELAHGALAALDEIGSDIETLTRAVAELGDVDSGSPIVRRLDALEAGFAELARRIDALEARS